MAAILLLILSQGLYAQAPTATTEAATGIGSTGATVNGTVNANGSSTTVFFEYGLTDEYGQTVPADQSPVSGSAATAVSANLSSLDPLTTYHYRVVATNASGTTYGADMTFTTTKLVGDAPVVITDAASGIGADFATLNGQAYTFNVSTVVTFQWGTDITYGNTVTADQSPVTSNGWFPVTATLTVLANNTTYHYRAVVSNANGTVFGQDMTFTIGTVGTAPTATTNAATGVGSSTATLNGTVNGNGASSVVTFEYGLNTGYGTTLPGNPNPVSGSTATSVSATFASFLPNTTYHFRVKATSLNGTTNGADMTFTTLPLPPTATTTVATSVTNTGATLNGTVNGNGTSTTVTFQYGLDTGYGTTVTATQSPVTGSTAVSKAITGLTNGVTYHYRVVATNGGGTSNGADMIFSPGSVPPAVTTDAATGVNPTNATLNGTVNANNSNTAVSFDYGRDTNYGRTVVATQGTVTGSVNTPINAGISPLLPNSTYHYRAVGVSIGGTTNGADMHFTTGPGPAVSTDNATAVGVTGATLNGTVNANNENTTVTFEYGLTATYGNTVPADQSPVSGSANTAVSKALAFLPASTTYHYRAVGQNASGTTYGADKTFTTGPAHPDAPTAITLTASGVGTTGATLRGSVDSKNQSTTITFEYGTTTAYGTTVTADQSPVVYDGGAVTVTKTITGLTPNTTYYYRVVAQNAFGTAYGADMTFFTSAGAAPTATTDAATAVLSSGATLNGTVNANNSSTLVSFEYGLTAAYGTTVTADQSPVSGAVNTPVSLSVTGLTNTTTYHYRVKAQSAYGTVYGADMTFTTTVPPTAVTDPASAVGATTATLNGTVNANGSTTTVTFEYGLDTNYGKVTIADQSPVTGSTATAVSNSLSSLQPNTTYHYRVKAENQGNTVYGADMTFTTGSSPPAATTEAATGVTNTGATLNGTVQAKNDNTTVTFEYGLTTGYGTTVTADQSPVTGNSITPVSKAITGLSGNTYYHYRVAGQNTSGTTYGADKMFFTGVAPPTVTTNSASGVGNSNATLNGTVNANNATTTVTFEYGPTTGYGKTINATPNTVTGSANYAVAAQLVGLLPSTTYHYRAIGGNSAGTTYGADMAFTTSSGNDSDGDGATDGTEGLGDRDGDGDPDYQDYDPTGYFYDESNAKIIAGGLINVVGPGVITILQNGSSGYYQWITDGTAGLYTMIVTLPPNYSWSTTCLVTAGALDPTVGPNPRVLGNGEDGSTGNLTSNACTQFYLQFDLEPGDPYVFNNNFPLKQLLPTFISLSSFDATSNEDGVTLNWVTASEPNVAGFYIYRCQQETGDYVKVNESLILAQGNTTIGATYSYTDKPEQTGNYYYKLQAVTLDGSASFYGPVFVGLTSADIEKYTVPKEYFLSQNYPNPFNPETTIDYGTPKAGFVEISIYNINGKLVRKLVSEEKLAGNHRINWDGRSGNGVQVSSGLYFYQMKAMDKANSNVGYLQTGKMILMK